MMLFLHGATCMGCLVAALYFLRFWRDTRERLFVLFGVAFMVLALNRAALALSHPTAESTPYFYLARLFAFLLIAYAVVDKNRRG
jgi:uncharacterized membrane protein HdeD (DUF308 family)